MSLTKEELGYLIRLLESNIEKKLETFQFDDIIELKNSSIFKRPETIIRKLRVLQKQSECLENARNRKRREKTQRNTTRIIS